MARGPVEDGCSGKGWSEVRWTRSASRKEASAVGGFDGHDTSAARPRQLRGRERQFLVVALVAGDLGVGEVEPLCVCTREEGEDVAVGRMRMRARHEGGSPEMRSSSSGRSSVPSSSMGRAWICRVEQGGNVIGDRGERSSCWIWLQKELDASMAIVG